MLSLPRGLEVPGSAQKIHAVVCQGIARCGSWRPPRLPGHSAAFRPGGDPKMLPWWGNSGVTPNQEGSQRCGSPKHVVSWVLFARCVVSSRSARSPEGCCCRALVLNPGASVSQ